MYADMVQSIVLGLGKLLQIPILPKSLLGDPGLFSLSLTYVIALLRGSKGDESFLDE